MAELHTIEPQNGAEDVIATLERALLKAKSGQVSAVGVATVYRNGNMGASWSSLPSTPMMLGAVSRLWHTLNLLLDEGTIPEDAA